MTQPSRGRPISRLFTALLALAAVGVFASSKAEAGCSHYALPKAQRDAQEALESLDVLPITVDTEGVIPSAPEQRRPCSGPSCSERPSAPGAPVPPAPTNGERECCILFSPELLAPGESRMDSRECSARVRHLSERLDRPPRSFPA
jgi:hypothetical protein